MRNDDIFNTLELDKLEFCRKSYGHEPNGGDFPECRKDYKKCLHQVTYDLFEECMKHCLSPVKRLKITDIHITL